MSLVGTIQSLFQDKERTKPIFPVTKVKAVSDDNGRGLNVLLEDIHTEIDELTYSDVGAAPAGYGLGETTSTTIQDCNEAIRNGWYVTGSVSETLNQPVHGRNPLPKGMLLVRARGVKIHQSYFACVSGVYATLERYSIGSRDTWTEWEWVNPPMLLGVEYRTTERWNCKVVYTKLINCGTMPNTANVNISGLYPTWTIVDYSVIFIKSTLTFALPIVDSTGTITARALCNTANSVIQIQTMTDYSAYTGYALIKYVKG